MSMRCISRYMHISRVIDFRSEEERYLKLPDSRKWFCSRESSSSVLSGVPVRQALRSALMF
jgi:hypothetical protein